MSWCVICGGLLCLAFKQYAFKSETGNNYISKFAVEVVLYIILSFSLNTYYAIFPSQVFDKFIIISLTLPRRLLSFRVAVCLLHRQNNARMRYCCLNGSHLSDKEVMLLRSSGDIWIFPRNTAAGIWLRFCGHGRLCVYHYIFG